MPKDIGCKYFMPEKKCALCGKTFVVQPYHRFVDNHKYYCKWTCYNHRNDKKKQYKMED